MASAAIKAHFLDSQFWAVLKQIMRVFCPNRDRVETFQPNRPHVLEFCPNRSRTDQFPGRGA